MNFAAATLVRALFPAAPMVVYEVNLRVAPDVLAAYRVWLGDHIAEILALGGFVAATVFADDAPDPDGWARLVVYYTLENRDALDRYLAHDAPRLRADGVARFGDRFAATRRILTVESVHPKEPFGWRKAG